MSYGRLVMMVEVHSATIGVGSLALAAVVLCATVELQLSSKHSTCPTNWVVLAVNHFTIIVSLAET